MEQFQKKVRSCNSSAAHRSSPQLTYRYLLVIRSHGHDFALFDSFRALRQANFYFLIMAVLSLTPISPKTPIVSVTPLVSRITTKKCQLDLAEHSQEYSQTVRVRVCALFFQVFVLAVSAIKEAFEDYARHEMDEEMNNTKVLAYDPVKRTFENKTWR